MRSPFRLGIGFRKRHGGRERRPPWSRFLYQRFVPPAPANLEPQPGTAPSALGRVVAFVIRAAVSRGEGDAAIAPPWFGKKLAPRDEVSLMLIRSGPQL